MRTTILALLILSGCGAEAIGIGPSLAVSTPTPNVIPLAPPPGDATACRPVETTCEGCGVLRAACVNGRLEWGACELPDGGCP